MAVTVTRTNTNMIGTPASLATITANSNATGTLDMTSPAGVTEGVVMAEVVTGSSAPTTAITVACGVSTDGTNYTADPSGSFTISTPANSTTYTFRYDCPDAAGKVQVKITNGSTNSITVYVQGQTLAVS